MKLRLTVVCLAALYCFTFVSSSKAQVNDPFADPLAGAATNIQIHERTGGVLFIRVLDEKQKKLDRQAVVKVFNDTIGVAKMQLTYDEAEAIFADLLPGKYRVEVSAVGYLTSTENVVIASSIANFHSEITLKKDTNAVELSAPGAGIAPKARKEISRAVAALNNADWKKALKHLDAAKRTAPSNSEVSFLTGYLHFMQNDLPSAKTQLEEAVRLNPEDAKALTLLGRVYLKQDSYPEAQKALEHAVKVAGEEPVARTALAETYLKQHEYERARTEAAFAIERSKGRATSAYLVLGTTLANLGKPKEANVAFNKYLQDYPNSPLKSQVNDLITRLESAANNPQQQSAPVLASAAALINSTLVADSDSVTALKSWEPVGVDDAKPPVDSSVACPLDTVLQNVGARMKVFLEDVARFEAIEEVQHQELNELGVALSDEKVRFDYVVDISEYKPGVFRVDEHRSGKSGVTDFPGNVATRGLPAMALVFHPGVNPNYRVTCEGLGGWNSKPAWLLYFRQRGDRPSTLHGYKIGEDVYSVDLKGRAWVDRETYQIMHVEVDMVKPMPQIQLLREHQVLDYAPVLFKSKNVELWLPKRAELYFNFRRHRYMRRHTFDNFLLFAVESTEEHKAPPQENNLKP